ncbi:DNA-binding transcriptional LysR family regulator [Psychromicrobium silvestre]|uniref:DNA-binding transcriptional LysR family regulator n=1 Tax=Psychromicrobium silvestre TaxID=1645614 RepID=A0A7Y9LTL6_9MICC|nr:LysR family transcriptional regulator [Psychromicrobium silvestre]NYE95423.1 DNA-binding transcriptional LysR family regulator [Psychromicrobium silvestre]
MELAQLRALRELRDRGSIAAVARALRVTPSSVSQQLSALARSAGCALTYKDGRRTALTDAGQALAAAAVGVEAALEFAAEAVRTFQEEPAGRVSIAAFHSASWALFPELLAEFSTANGTEVSFCDEDVAQEDFPKLVSDYDLVIGHRLANGSPWPVSVRVEPLFYEPLDVAMPVSHRLAAKGSLEVSDLRDESWIAVHQGFPLRGAIELISSLCGQEAKIVHQINEFYVTARLVEASDCIALMPRYTIEQRIYPGLVLKPLVFPQLGRQVDCLMRPEVIQRGNVQAVLQSLHRISAQLLNP